MEVIGTVAGAVSAVIKLADFAISTFDRIQNAPRELQDFRRAVLRLQRHFEILETVGGDLPQLLNRDDIEAIQITLEECKDLLQQQVNLQSGGMVNGVLRGVWSFRNNQTLIKYKNEIDMHYSQILVPGWLQSISARVSAPSGPLPFEQGQVSTTVTSSVKKGPSISQKQLRQISDRLQKLDDTNPPGENEQQLCTIDYELQTCWVEMGLWDEKIVEPLNTTVPRRSSLNFEHAPTTLFVKDNLDIFARANMRIRVLTNAPHPHQEIKLERLHIMARDDESRILQYQNLDATIHVTHVVPFGSIPWTETKKPKQVSFLKPHMITVIDKNGYHIYKLDPKYKFKNQVTCERFQSTLRERAFCGAFEAVEIKMDRTIVSSRQMIRFWQRAESNTITFLLSSVDTARPGCHEEVDISKLAPLAEYSSSWRLGKRAQKIIIKPIFQGASRIRIKFDTERDALDFKARYEAIRGGQQDFGRVGSFSTASFTSAKTPTEQLHDWRSMMDTIHNA